MGCIAGGAGKTVLMALEKRRRTNTTIDVTKLTWSAIDESDQPDHWNGFSNKQLVATLTRMRSGQWRVTAKPLGCGNGDLHRVVETKEDAAAFMRLHLEGVPTGTTLMWTAPAPGGRVEKVGVVEVVLHPGQDLSAAQRLETGARGIPRELRSYLVRVKGADDGAGKLHWPRTVDLTVVSQRDLNGSRPRPVALPALT